MSKLFDWFNDDCGITPSESELQEIRNIVLEEAGFNWIPVSERLPEYPVMILASTPEGEVLKVIDWMKNENATVWYSEKYQWSTNVIAWMPLPKPYDPQP